MASAVILCIVIASHAIVLLRSVPRLYVFVFIQLHPFKCYFFSGYPGKVVRVMDVFPLINCIYVQQVNGISFKKCWHNLFFHSHYPGSYFVCLFLFVLGCSALLYYGLHWILISVIYIDPAMSHLRDDVI